MASSQSSVKFFANNCVELFTHMPADGATEQSVKAGTTTACWRDMRDYEGFAVGACQAVKGGNGMIELSIYAAESDSGANATEIKTTGVIAADAIGDYALLECTAEEIAQIGRAAGYAFTHVAGYIDSHHNDDEQGVVYIRYGAKRPAASLSETTIT